MLFISPPFGNYLSFDNCISIKGSYTLEPRPGLIVQILKTLRYDFEKGAWINKIGLRNRGVDYGIENYNSKNEVLSVAVLNPEDIEKLVEKIPNNTNLEINVSCPNAGKKMIDKNIDKFLGPSRKWCILKLSPLVTKEQIDCYYNQGFRQFHCSNTIPVEKGGQSGKEIIKYNEETIPYIKETYKDTVVIGGGGIQDLQTIQKYKELGADHFSISTVLFNPIKSILLFWDLKNKT